MNLLAKLFLTFALIIVVALGSAGWLINRSAESAYYTYLNGFQQRQLQVVADQVAIRYVENRSWAGIQQWLDQTNLLSSTMPGMGAGRMGRGMGMGQNQQGAFRAGTLIVVDAESGVPLASNAPTVDQNALAAGIPIVQWGEVVAILVARLSLPTIGPAEAALLSHMNQAILLSALGAGAVALLVGIPLILSILRPLHQLETAVTSIARGDLASQVDVSSTDEIGQLARRFNQMATTLRKQEELRQRLVGDIAHELRTPLSVIQGNLQAMLDGVYPLEESEIETIFGETRLLARLINDLHELTQAEAGRLPLARQRIDVSAVLISIADIFTQAATAKQITFIVDDQAQGTQVAADPERLHQILHNLLGNALRHTPEQGMILLGAALLPNGDVHFRVKDSGPGISPEDLPHVFDRFYRAESSRTRDLATSGVGLGLAIVKALVEAHEGQVGVTSKAKEGTEFWFTLPAA